MGRSRGGLIVAPSHIKMNKLLLALAIGLSLLALAAGSSKEENQVERFESGLAREAREADPAKGQRKSQAKRKNQSTRKNKSKKKNQAKRKNQDKRKNKKGNKKGRSNKRKGLKGKKGGKGQKGKRISKKSNIGSKKSAKKDVFGPTLQRLSDAAGGNLSAPVCAGNASSPGAAQMLN